VLSLRRQRNNPKTKPPSGGFVFMECTIKPGIETWFVFVYAFCSGVVGA